jgi:hypothetical protein
MCESMKGYILYLSWSVRHLDPFDAVFLSVSFFGLRLNWYIQLDVV